MLLCCGLLRVETTPPAMKCVGWPHVHACMMHHNLSRGFWVRIWAHLRFVFRVTEEHAVAAYCLGAAVGTALHFFFGGGTVVVGTMAARVIEVLV